jgi:hypothetical protein
MRFFACRSMGLFALLVWITGCAEQPVYSRYDGSTRQIADNGIRYGTIAAAGVGGYFLGQKFIGGAAGGALGALGGVAVSYGLTKFYDNKRMLAYMAGIKDGQDSAQSEIANEIYRREVLYGLPPPWEADSNSSPTIRNVYVPTRMIDGVQYRGDYQRVPVYK